MQKSRLCGIVHLCGAQIKLQRCIFFFISLIFKLKQKVQDVTTMYFIKLLFIKFHIGESRRKFSSRLVSFEYSRKNYSNSPTFFLCPRLGNERFSNVFLRTSTFTQGCSLCMKSGISSAR